MGVTEQGEVGLEEQIDNRQAPFAAALVQHQLVNRAVRTGQLGCHLDQLRIRAEVVLGGAALMQVRSVGGAVDTDPVYGAFSGGGHVILQISSTRQERSCLATYACGVVPSKGVRKARAHR